MINSLSIHDLIETLQELAEEHGEDTQVMASCDYGDICHTEQLINIESIEVIVPGTSAYSLSGLCYPDEEDLEDDFEGTGGEIDPNDFEEEQKVVVLRYI